MANTVVRSEMLSVDGFTKMLQRNYSVVSQTVPIKSSFATKLIPYPWVTSDFFTTDTRDRGLELVFLDFVTPSPICSIPCGATSFLRSHSQLCRFFSASS